MPQRDNLADRRLANVLKLLACFIYPPFLRGLNLTMYLKISEQIGKSNLTHKHLYISAI